MTFLFLVLLILLLFVLFNRINIINRKVEQLEKDVNKLRETSYATKSQLSEEPETPKATGQTAAAAPPSPASISLPVQQPPEHVQLQQPQAATQRKQRSRAEWEALVGGKLLNRIGALALIFGAGFFLKYAFDNNWINETMRVLIGVLTGAGLLFAGARLKKNDLAVFAQGLTGTGISILYLSVYASFNFYHLVPQTPAFLLMSIVTVLAFWQAFKFDSLTVSVLGWAGGYLTPFLLSTGQANEVSLFTYIAILEAGLLAIVLKKEKWTVLEPLTVVATYIVYSSWHIEYYTKNDLLLTLFFITIFWGLFFALDVIRNLKTSTRFSALRRGIAAFNAVYYFASVYFLLYSEHENQLGAVTLAIGLVYFLTMLAIKKKNPTARAAFSQYTVTAIILLIVATAIQYSGFTIVALWSIEAFLLIFCSIRWRLEYVQKSALALFIFSAMLLLNTRGALAYRPIEDFTIFFNLRFLVFFILTATSGMSAYLLRRELEISTLQIVTFLQIGCCITFLVLITVETLDIFEKAIYPMLQNALQSSTSDAINRLKNLQQLTLSGVWLFYSILLMAAGLWRRIQGVRLAAIALFGISILKVFIYDLSYLDTLYRIFSFISLGVILLGVSYLYQKNKLLIFKK